MIGIVLVCFNNLGTAYTEALERVVGPQEKLVAIDVPATITSPSVHNALTKKVQAAIKEVNTGSGTLVLVDMFGASTANAAIAAMGNDESIEVVAGFSLPLLVRVARLRDDSDLDTVVREAMAAGHKYLTRAATVLEAHADPDLDGFASLALTAASIASQLEGHVKELLDQRPNDKLRATQNAAYADFLSRLLLKIRELESALYVVLNKEKTVGQDVAKADTALTEAAAELSEWWKQYRADAVDWCIRFPAIGGAIGLLNLAGATPLLATSAAIAAIGGPKLYKAIRNQQEK